MKIILTYFIWTTVFIFPAMSSSSFGTEDVQQEKQSDSGTALKIEFPNAIILKAKEIKSFDMIKTIQQEYIRERYKDYSIVFNTHMRDSENHLFEVFLVENDEGQRKLVSFKMDEVYKYLKKKDKKTVKQSVNWRI